MLKFNMSIKGVKVKSLTFSLLLLSTLYLIPATIYASKPWLDRLRELWATQEFYSRYNLYDKMLKKKEHLNNPQFIEHLKKNNDRYRALIEPYILKREQGEKKATSISRPRIIKGTLAYIASPLIYAGSNYLENRYQEKLTDLCSHLPLSFETIQFPLNFTLAAAPLYYGSKNLYKGINHKSRMKEKLDRDLTLRTALRTIGEKI